MTSLRTFAKLRKLPKTFGPTRIFSGDNWPHFRRSDFFRDSKRLWGLAHVLVCKMDLCCSPSDSDLASKDNNPYSHNNYRGCWKGIYSEDEMKTGKWLCASRVSLLHCELGLSPVETSNSHVWSALGPRKYSNFQNVASVHFLIDFDSLVHKDEWNPATSANSTQNHYGLRILLAFDNRRVAGGLFTSFCRSDCCRLIRRWLTSSMKRMWSQSKGGCWRRSRLHLQCKHIFMITLRLHLSGRTCLLSSVRSSTFNSLYGFKWRFSLAIRRTDQSLIPI